MLNWVNPVLGKRMALDREKFDLVMDAYLRIRGWDVDNGWPTQETLARLDISDVYEPMVAGAQRAKATLPELPPERPVVDIHKNDPERDE